MHFSAIPAQCPVIPVHPFVIPVHLFVIPAQAGIQRRLALFVRGVLDPRLRGGDV